MNSRGDAISTTAGEDMSVDWKGRPCKPSKHGGMTAAVFVLGLSLSLSLLYLYLFLCLSPIYVGSYDLKPMLMISLVFGGSSTFVSIISLLLISLVEEETYMLVMIMYLQSDYLFGSFGHLII